MPRLLALLCVAVLLLAPSAPAAAQSASPAPVDLVTWNIGLGDADLETIGRRLAAFDGVDLWGLQEVNSRSAPSVLAQAAAVGEAGDFAAVQGRAGDGLHLVALYDAGRFDLVDWWEIDEINTTGNARPPLVLHLQEPANGLEFLFMVNHLYRSRDAERHRQAELLAEWAAEQTLPVIAVGDYNFDWAIGGGASDHDTGYDLLTADGSWTWVQPDTLVTTQCSGWPCRYESVLDFVFTAGPAQEWRAESEIVVEAGDFPDDATTPDHRPVAATFWPAQESAADTRSPATANANANLRSGPGTGYAVAGRAQAGDALAVVGRSADGSWLELAGGLWIAAFLVDDAPSGSGVVSEPVAVATPAGGNRTAGTVAAPAPAAAQPPDPEPAPAGTPAVQLLILANRGSEEILEIRNAGGAPLDLGGWRLDGSKGDDACVVPAGTTLAPGAGYQVATGESQPQGDGVKCANKPIWNNEGETIYLRGPEGFVLEIESVRR